MKNNMHGFTDDNCQSLKPCMLFFIQTLPHILCTGATRGATSLARFLDLFGAINPIMKSLHWQEGVDLAYVVHHIWREGGRKST